jgi:hypothetical protein
MQSHADTVGATDSQILLQSSLSLPPWVFWMVWRAGMSVPATLVSDLKLNIPGQITGQSVVLAVGIFPQTNCVCECFHRTIQVEFYARKFGTLAGCYYR